jgi:DUF1680 family protein
MTSPLPRAHVRLLAGPLGQRQALNGRYLLQLDADRLLHNFRANAGLPSTAVPLGGWENPACGLRGHFTGHYLSACAAMFAATGDARFTTRLDELLTGLRACQAALGDGYLSAFPITEFDTLEARFGGVWAPYYTLQKILAGLIDAHRDAARPMARDMAVALGDWVARRLARLLAETLEPMLRTDQLNPANEFGGIGAAMYDLFALTGRPEHLSAAHTFDRDWFLAPLADGQDRLAGLHANTHLPQGIAAARRFDLTGDDRARRAARQLWERTALDRSYVNGGSSGPRPDHRERSEGGEHWPDAGRLGGTLTPKINESCVTHNMLRLTDAVANWSDDPRPADFRERARLNAVAGTQHPTEPGGYLYNLPLAGGSRKVYGDADGTFWCCYGTGVEAFARLADGAYATEGDALHVRQFIASEVAWGDVRLVQTTGFPYEQATRLTVHVAVPAEFALNLRVPTWAAGAACRVNGQPVPTDGGRALVRRRWADGDVLELTLPMSVHVEPLPGDPTLIAFLHGPVVLAARTPHAPELGVPGSRAVGLATPVDVGRLRFQVTLVSGVVVPLVPLSEIVDEAYGVYFKVPEEAGPP